MEYIAFFAIAWLTLLIPGFDDSVPPTGDKIFKIEYSDVVQSITTKSDEYFGFQGFDIELKQNSDTYLDIKIPKNLPIPASFINIWHYDERPIVLEDGKEIDYDIVDDPCYSHYKIPIEEKKSIEVIYTVILTGNWKLYSPIQFDVNDPCYNKVLDNSTKSAISLDRTVYPYPQDQIENFDGMLYYISAPIMPNSSVEKMNFHDVVFSLPYRNDPPRYTYSDVMFSDGTKERLSVIHDYPDFTEHIKPQAGLIQRNDGYHFLVSINLKELSPLKQIKSGIKWHNVECHDNLELVYKKGEEKSACVTLNTKIELTVRGWADDMRVLLGCTNDRYYKCYPEDKNEYRKLLQNYYYGTEPILESGTLQKQQQAKLHTQEVILTDYRGNEHQINAINEYRNEFELGYFLEQFILFPNKQNYEKDDLINFVFIEWGYQPQECTSPKVEVYLRPYENYDSIEKINEWQKPEEECRSIDSDSNGYLIVNIWPMPGMPEAYQTCTIPGEYRIDASNLNDESNKELGYFTCQQDQLTSESKPSLCAKYDGKWDDEHLTCDYVNANSCNAMNGKFQECKTSEYRCPHNNPECFVTAECISSCIFENSLQAGEENEN